MKRCPAGKYWDDFEQECVSERKYYENLLIYTMDATKWKALSVLTEKPYPYSVQDKKRLISSIRKRC